MTDDEPMDDDAIRVLLTRLARRHRSGGVLIERAALMAEGVDSAAVLEWIEQHGGVAEAQKAPKASGGLHAARREPEARETLRFVLPAGVL